MPNGPSVAALAFDRNTVRSKDGEGRLHVATTNISKANICPYLGREIPDAEGLGLDPGKIYHLLRDPEELEKAASSFNNLPLLSTHVPVSADDHHPDLVIGSTGTDATFDAPYLKNSLVIWARDAINDIESEIKKELSCGYRYRADMTPGTYEGKSYDGVMRDIIGNHVALVREGRAGKDVVVGDAALEKDHSNMANKPLTRKAAVAQGALLAYLRPKLAADAKIDITPLLAGVNAKNFAAKKPAIIEGVKKRTAGKLAQDADLDDIVALLDAIEPEAPAEDEEAIASPDKEEARKDDKAMDDEPMARLKAICGDRLSDEELARIAELFAPAASDEDKTEANSKAEEKKAEDADEDTQENEEDMVTKPAMDAAIAAAEKRASEAALSIAREIRNAERHVRPHVGELAQAHDSAESVYRGALKVLNYEKADTVPAAALSDVFELAAKAAASAKSPAREARVAMDAAAAKDYEARFPHANRLAR